MSLQSSIHSLDPRTKLFIVIIMIIMTIYQTDLKGLWWIFCGTILITLLLKISLKIFIETILTFWILLTFALIIHLLPYNANITKGIFYSFRLYLFIIFAIIFNRTTSALELTLTLKTLLKPLTKFKIPIENFCLILTLCIKFFPLIITEVKTLIKAQESRGANFKIKSLRQRISQLYTVIIPLFINSLRRADQLAQSIDIRAFDGTKFRTSTYQLKFSVKDYIIFILVIILVIIIYV